MTGVQTCALPISAGGPLTFGGHLKSINGNKVIINYKNKDYLLRPLFSVEGIETGPDGQVFARMHWGGHDGEIYYYRVGDSLYGGGIIEAIDEQQVSIDWKGTKISLTIID